MKNLDDVALKKLGKLRMRFLPLAARQFPFSILHEELPPHARTPVIFHKKTHEYVIVLRGRGTAMLDGRRHALRKGSIFAIPAGAVHQFMTGLAEMEALSVFSPPLSKKKPDVHLVHDKNLEVRLS